MRLRSVVLVAAMMFVAVSTWSSTTTRTDERRAALNEQLSALYAGQRLDVSAWALLESASEDADLAAVSIRAAALAVHLHPVSLGAQAGTSSPAFSAEIERLLSAGQADDVTIGWLLLETFCIAGADIDRLVNRAAELGSSDALYELGSRHLDAGDYATAESYLALAADAEHPDALLKLGLLRMRSESDSDRYRAGVAQVERAYELGEPAAGAVLAELIAEGRVANRTGLDPTQLIVDAANMGVPSALVQLGYLYRSAGEPEQASIAWRAAAERANLDADELLRVLGNGTGRGAALFPGSAQDTFGSQLDWSGADYRSLCGQRLSLD